MFFKLRTNSGLALHSAVPELADGFLRGEVDRRAFLRTVALLGVSATSARAFVGAVAPMPAAAQETPKTGGVLRMAGAIMEITDPSLVTWIEASNEFRNSLEFLTLVDADNITHPYLAASWDPSEDLKTWKFKLRPGVKWSNGDDLTSEDVAFTFKHWTDPNSKSSNKTSFAGISLAVTGPLEFTLTLAKADLAVPEKLYAYTCPILHRKFVEQGANWSKNPVGTGPYQMVEYAVGQKAIFKRRAGYWGEAPYLDELHYLDLGTEVTANIAALAAGQVDMVPRIGATDVDLVKRLPNTQLLTAHAAQGLSIRMQTDQKPFDDLRVRQAMVLAADNQRMLDLAYRGLGVVAENHHVAPFQPEYFKLPPLKRDVARAKALLADAGYKDGLDVTLVVGNTQGKWEQDTAQVLQQQVAEAGIRIKLNVLPATEYWPIWNKVPFGVTFWAHRPLAVMTLDLAYRGGAAWNESHLKSAAFDTALDRAVGIVDPKARGAAMETVERLLQESCVMVQPYWNDKFGVASTRVKNVRLHPADYNNHFKTWLA